MKKIVIPLLWGLFATIPQPLPATSYKSIIVNQSDGSEMKVTIEDDMKTTVAEGNLVITCTKGDIVLPVIDIKNWTFSTSAGSDDVWTGIESPTASGTNCILNSDRIILSNLPEGSTVSLCSIDGRIVKSSRAEGDYEFSISELPKGIYVLTYNKNTLKIAVAK